MVLQCLEHSAKELRAASASFLSCVDCDPSVALAIDLPRLFDYPSTHVRDVLIRALSSLILRWRGLVDIRCPAWKREDALGPRLLAILESAPVMRVRSLVINHYEDVSGALGLQLGKLADLQSLRLQGPQNTAVLASCLPDLPLLKCVALSRLAGSDVRELSSSLLRCKGLQEVTLSGASWMSDVEILRFANGLVLSTTTAHYAASRRCRTLC